MSLLPPEIHQAVNQLLIGLQASDNIVRTQAEESLNSEWIAPRAEVLLMALAEQILGAEEIGVRDQLFYLLRRILTANLDTKFRCSSVPPRRKQDSESPWQRRH